MLPCPVGSVGARGTHARRSLLLFDRRLLSTPKAALLENTPLTTPNTYCVSATLCAITDTCTAAARLLEPEILSSC